MWLDQVIPVVFYLLKLPILITSIALSTGLRFKAVHVRWACFVTGSLLFIYVLVLFRAMIPPDFHIFWRAGRDVWAGIDPYSPERFSTNPFLNPPTALPLFAVFALLPFRPSFVIWTLLNLVICLALPAYCLRVLNAQERIGAGTGWKGPVIQGLTWSELVCLGAALAVSDSFVRGLYAGQLGLLTAVALIAALGCQAKGQPILAGACLALATIKVITMLPFLVLFHRKSDLKTWLAMGLAGIALCLAPGRPRELPGQLANLVQRVETLGAPGKVNDYSFEGTQDESIIGFDHLFYRLGLRDRQLIRVLQYVAVAASGLWVAWQVLVAGLPRGAACSLVALYSMVFLYHRDYDTLILALPLVYCVGRARAEPGTTRRLFAICAVAIYIILYLNLPVLMFLTAKSREWGLAGRLIQASLLPYATWSIVLVAIGIVTAESLARGREPAQ
jgi:hypothetical protein